MASIELLDEETLNVSLSDDIGLESNINDPESINVEQLPNDYVPSYTESDPIFVSSPAANIKEDDITNWNSKSDFDGDYESLTNKPTIPTVPTNLSSFTDDLGNSPTHTHSQYLTEHQDISGKVDKETGKGLSSNDFTDAYKSNVDSNTSARHSHSNKSVLDDISSSDVSNWDSKQEALVSGTNIKTINNTSLLGSGNITIQGGGGGTATDVQINGTSITSNDVANIVTEGTYNASTNKIATMSDVAKIFYVDTDTTTYTYAQINGLIEDGYEIRAKTDEYMGLGYGHTICNMVWINEHYMLFSFVDFGLTGELYYDFNDNVWKYDEDSFAFRSEIAHYGASSSAADSQNKTVLCYDLGFKLEQNAVIFVKFTYGNTYDGTITLNVNSKGARDVAVVGDTKTSRYYWSPGEVVGFVYDGTNFVMIGKGTASTTYYGVTKLSSSTSSTSEELAATPKAVKTVADSIPTKVSDLTNDSGYITSYTETDPVFTSSVAHGITSTDITNWNNKSTFSGNYNDLTNKPTIPDELSDLSDDSTHRLVTDTEKSTWNSKSDFSGSYNDLSNKPTIPTKVSDLTNDSGFITNSYHDSSKQDSLVSGTNIKTINNTSLLGSGDIGFETIQEISGESSIRIKNLDGGIYKIYGETYGTDLYYNSNDSLSVSDWSYAYLIVTEVNDIQTVRHWVYIGNMLNEVCYGYSWLSYGYCYNVTSAEEQAAITGILSNLTTTAKTNLVSAINELDSTKQDTITSSNKLDYALLSNTPTIPTVPTAVSSFTNDAGYITGITSSDVTTALGYTPEKATTLIIDNSSFLNITSTSDSIFQEIKDAIDNEKSFKILYEDFMDSSKYYLDTENYTHVEHYLGQPESYSFCYMQGDIYTEVKYTISGTTITTTTTNYSKQDELVSGTNIKTINGNSILGSGNLTINASAEVSNLLVALGLDTETYSTSTTYAVGDTVVYNNTVYECNTANTTGTWDSTKWDLVPVIVND